MLLSLVTELVSPVSWLHYWVFVGLAPILAVVEWRRDRVLAVASIVLALSTCANLDNTFVVAAPFTTIAPFFLFVVRNLYVLGGLIFLGAATCQAWRWPMSGSREGEVEERVADRVEATALIEDEGAVVGG